MPKTNRVGSTLDTLATLTTPKYADILRWQYNRLNDHRKQTIYNDLHIGRDGNKATRAQTRIRRLIIHLEPYFGRFTGAFLRAASDHPHILDHWELERIICHTATGVLTETTRNRFPQWLTEKNRYANSCGLFTNL